VLALQAAGEHCPYTTSWQSWVHVDNTNAWHNNPMASENNGLSGSRPALNFNGHLMIRHISLMAAWVRSELLRSPSHGDESDARFASGECVALTSSSAALPAIRAKARFDVGVAALPRYDDFNNAPYGTLAGGSALWVMAGGAPREYAGVARFLAWLSKPAVALDWQQSTGSVPATQSVYAALQRGGYYKANPAMEVPVMELRGMRPGAYSRGLRLGNMPAIRAILDQELDAVWSGDKAPITALDESVQRGNAVLRTFDRAHSGK
jgi:sn-glycerol 3-phosphate transport system substrate-binding protein